MRNKITDVVKTLIIINVLVHLCIYLLPSKEIVSALDLAFFHPYYKDYFKPFQIVTHMFTHGSEQHIFFNMLSLFFLGPYVERLMGTKRFLTLYLVSGFVALAAHYAWQSYQLSIGSGVGPVLGASGALYGVIISFVVLFPNEELQLIFPPIPIKAKYMGIGLIAIDVFMHMGGVQDGVAHLAHLGGACAGGLLTYLWYYKR